MEINVEVIEENRQEEEPEEEDEEYSIDSGDSEADLDLAVFVEIVGERGEGNQWSDSGTVSDPPSSLSSTWPTTPGVLFLFS